MSQIEIRIAGFGGQGVILCGMILGRAGCIYDTKHATLTQSLGPEARGGACAVQIIIADRKIRYPYVMEPDVLAVMSQGAAVKFVPGIKPGGALICEEDLVRLDPLPDEAIETMVRGAVPELPAAALAAIVERSAGIPLYMVETLRMLIDRGQLVRA